MAKNRPLIPHQITSKGSIGGNNTAANIAKWSARAHKNSNPGGIAPDVGCQTTERDSDLPNVKTTGKVSVFDTNVEAPDGDS